MKLGTELRPGEPFFSARSRVERASGVQTYRVSQRRGTERWAISTSEQAFEPCGVPRFELLHSVANLADERGGHLGEAVEELLE